MKDLDSLQTARSIAKSAGLTYVSDQGPGLTRGRKTRQGFQFFDTKGKLLRDETQLKRIYSLVIPPAWKNVWISPAPSGHLQATGRDARGRKQYRYHAGWNKARNEDKFSRMLLFAKKLPEIRGQIKKDLKAEGLGKRRVTAAIVEIMEQTMIRIGNAEYARENSSYGLTTILNRHVSVSGSKIHFKFKGKSGKWHDVKLEDQQLAKIVHRCQDLPGQELFAYLDENGKAIDITSADVNEYLMEITDEHITAKDFRTWGGTVRAAVKLQDLGPSRNKKELKKSLLRAVEHTSEHLRNTVSVCRKYYIHPCVFESYESGSLFKIHASCRRSKAKSIKGLFPDEIFTLKLLQSSK
jgi:DNA topoisomerase-1